MMKGLSFVMLLAFLLAFSSSSATKIIGYFISWGVYARDYHVPDIPATKTTHINYAFANISSDGKIMLGDSYADIDKYYPGDSWDPESLRGNFHQLIKLKERYPHIKTLISVGGWTWSWRFPSVAVTESARQKFAKSCAEFVIKYKFDGVDIDWEYPTAADKHNFTLLLAALRQKLDSIGTIYGRHYLLTIAAPAGPHNIANIEVDSIVRYLDWINLMTYDYHGPWSGPADAVTNLNAPLYPSSRDPLGEPYHSLYNQSATVDTYIALGVPPQKLVLGLPFYGRGYGNVSTTGGINGLFASYSGHASVGTWEAGVFDFYDLYHNYVDTNGYTRYWEDDAKVPWLFNPTARTMISYDDTQSIGEKVRFAIAESLGGVMFWEFSCDRDEMLIDKIYDILVTSVGEELAFGTMPSKLTISVAPNPFNRCLRITLPEIHGDNWSVEIYSLAGKRVWGPRLSNGSVLLWRPEDNIASGVYVIRAFTDKINATARVVYLK